MKEIHTANVLKSVDRSGSFGVASGSAFSVAATPNVPLVRLP